MTITRSVEHHYALRALLLGVLALAPLGGACAWQSAPPAASRSALPVIVVLPPPSVQFQQTVQQQQLRDQLQKSQLEQQLRQGVSDNTKRPHAGDPKMLQQLDQSDRAQRDRERVRQQDLLERYQNESLPRVVPAARPAAAHSDG